MPRLPTATEDATWFAVATSLRTRSSTLLVAIHRTVPGGRGTSGRLVLALTEGPAPGVSTAEPGAS
jgi:hypothetical protein